MRAIGLVCLAGILWGTVGVATGLMPGGAALDPTLAALSRTAMGALVLLLAALLLRVPRGDLPWRLLALFGIAGAVFQITLFASFAAVGVTVTVVVTVCLPIVLLAMAETCRTRTLPEPWTAVAILTAGAGVVLARFGAPGEPGPVDHRAWGTALVATSAVAFAIVAAAGRALGARLHPARAAGLGLAATALALSTCVAARAPALPTALTGRDVLILAYVGVVATGGAYLVFVAGMALARSASVGLAATLLEPAVAAVLAAIVLHEQMAPLERTGCLLVVLGILALAVGERRRPSRPA